MALAVAQDSEEKAFDGKTLKMLGFKVMLAWHYLVLFSPLFIAGFDTRQYSNLFERQLTLFLALAVSFGVLSILGRFFIRKDGTMPKLSLMCVAGVLATLATVLSVLVLEVDTKIWLAVVALLAFSQAFLMFLWLHYYMAAVRGHLFRSFSIDMAAGGLLALLICCLQAPLNLIIATCLPAITIVSLVMNWRTMEPVETPAEGELANAGARAADPAVGEDGKRPSILAPENRGQLYHTLITLLPTGAYAFVFGLLQGAFLVGGVALLMAGNAFVLAGVIVAATIICFIPGQVGTILGVDTLHRFSLLLFVLGIVGLAFFKEGGAVLLVLSEIAILAGFNLFDFGGLILGIELTRRYRPGSPLFVDGGRVGVYVCLSVGLVVGHAVMLGMGDAEGQNYMLLALCGISIALLVATVLTPFQGQVFWESQIAQRSGAAPSEGEAEDAKSTAKAAATAKASAKQAAQEAEHSASGTPQAEGKRGDTPWRRTCREIAELYRLSPRETEIFFLIAKGRNAEYVQQKLVISTHTAKTHIANIYHKLGVHSSQEMLSLIETFREEDIKARNGEKRSSSPQGGASRH